MILFLTFLSFLLVNSFSPKYKYYKCSFCNKNYFNDLKNEKNLKSLLKSIWNDYDNDKNKPLLFKNESYYDDDFDKSIFKKNKINKKNF